jgi:hypothetical protein
MQHDGDAKMRGVYGGSTTPDYSLDDFGPQSTITRVPLQFPSDGATLAEVLWVVEGVVTDSEAWRGALSCARGAKRLLDRVDGAELLRELFADGFNRRAVASAIAHVDHLGFLVPRGVANALPRAASDAGFDVKLTTTPSVVVSRELGSLSGFDEVPTRILKAYGTSAFGTPVCLEAFSPDARDGLVNAWVRDGVCTHIAVRLHRTASLSFVKRAFEAEGFVVPAFMNDKPMTNKAEGLTLMYFDTNYLGRRMRVECLAETD